MERIKVLDSSNIAGVGYDKSSKTLQVEFHSGGIYNYNPVSKELYEDLMEANSIGSFLNKNIIHNKDIKCKKSGSVTK